MPPSSQPIFVSGSTGYIGGRLVVNLLKKGYSVRAAGRSLQKLKSRSWADHPGVDLVRVDVLDWERLKAVTESCLAGYYLIPPIRPFGPKYDLDFKAAENMAAAAGEAGWKQLIHLSDIWQDYRKLSPYLKARQQVQTILETGRTPVTSLHAAVILGCGNAAFEILHGLADRFPLIPYFPWMRSPCQPIAITDVIEYLTDCLLHPETMNRSFDIGGLEVLNYKRLMEIYLSEARLSKRRFIRLPIIGPRLSSYWVHLATPVAASYAYLLAESLRDTTTCQNHDIRQIFARKPLRFKEAFRHFIDQTTERHIETHWTDAGITPAIDWLPRDDDASKQSPLFKDIRTLAISATAEDLWRSLVRIGGDTGWYYGNWLWRLRGFMDRLVGGVGLNRGRRDPDDLRPGDALDLWRVRIADSPGRLLLVAEMKMPGRAVLDFQIRTIDEQTVELKQTALYKSEGILGTLYWFSVLPFHSFIFEGMIRGIAKATRLYHRHSFQCPVGLELENKEIRGRLKDLSHGGCRVSTAKKLKKETLLYLKLTSFSGLATKASVVESLKSREGWYISLKFINVQIDFQHWLNDTIERLGD